VTASRLGQRLLTVRAAPSGSPALVKAPTGAVELREDRHVVGSVKEGRQRRGDGGGAELRFVAWKSCNRGDGWILFILRGVVEG
jgi:hypothetical protein